MRAIFAAAMLAALTLHTASAEMYKCSKNGVVSYQAKPCSGYIDDSNTISIKQIDPKQREQSAERLRQVQDEYQTRKQQRAEADEKWLQQSLRQSEVEAAQRNAAAQDQQAIEMRRQAAAMERLGTAIVPGVISGRR